MKTNVFEDKGNFSSEKNVLVTFSPIIECGNAQGTTYEGIQGILTTTAGVGRSFL